MAPDAPPIPGHVCNAYCTPGEHCEVIWSTFDHTPRDTPSGPFESVRRHYDDAYRRRYGARVVRCEPAPEALPVEQTDPELLIPLVGTTVGRHPWLVWFVPPGPAAAAASARLRAVARWVGGRG